MEEKEMKKQTEKTILKKEQSGEMRSQTLGTVHTHTHTQGL